MKKYQWAMGLAAVILGLVLGLQFRYAVQQGAAGLLDTQAAQLVKNVAGARQENDTLLAQVDALRKQLDGLTNQPQLANLTQELETARIEAGVDTVTGPGIQVTLNDSAVPFAPGQNPNNYVLHDTDVLQVLNEIKAAGGEAFAINDHRLLAGSEIRCIGPAILVNQTLRLTPPFVITAIGDPDTLAGALDMRGGVVDDLRYAGIQVTVQKVDRVTVPAYAGVVNFEYARPVGGKTS